MRDEYERLIAEHDKTLSMLTEQWKKASPKDRGAYMGRINAALDERLRLMKLRDK